MFVGDGRLKGGILKRITASSQIANNKIVAMNGKIKLADLDVRNLLKLKDFIAAIALLEMVFVGE